MSSYISSLFLVVFFVLPFPTQAQPAPGHEALMADIVYLSADLLTGRGTGTTGEDLAASYIAHRFEDLGLEPAFAEDSWYQPFSFSFNPNPHAADDQKISISGKNVGAWIDNGQPYTIVVGAHYDHLGMGSTGSRAPGQHEIHNGADDNASGVAGMLEIARLLRDKEIPANVLFVAFSGEEYGLMGSKAFLESSPIDLKMMSYMLNLDMVGRLNDEQTLVINGTGTSPSWSVLDDLAEKHGLNLSKHESGLGASDHTSFYLKDIPALHFFTGQHAEYHKPEDDSELINYRGVADISEFAVALVEAVSSTEPLAFTATKDAQQGRTMTAMKVTLGIMPDYVYDGEGLRIDAVLEDRPAKTAGMEGGDILIQLGEKEIKDVYAYMEALGALDKGMVVDAVVLRGEKEIKMKVTF